MFRIIKIYFQVVIIALLVAMVGLNGVAKAQNLIPVIRPDSPVIFFEEGQEKLEEEINNFQRKNRFEPPLIVIDRSLIPFYTNLCEQSDIDCIKTIQK